MLNNATKLNIVNASTIEDVLSLF